MSWWVAFTTSITILLRWWWFDNVVFDTFVWIAFSIWVASVLDAFWHDAFGWHLAWIALFLVSRTARERFKDSYGEYGGDYDAP